MPKKQKSLLKNIGISQECGRTNITREEERLEQAKFYNDKGVKDPHVHFLRGSEWADSTMIDKACEWLEKKAILYVWEHCELGEHGIHKKMLEDFRKAMKGD